MKITVLILFVLVIFKFLIDIAFIREGGLASAMVPLFSFVLFNVDWILISWVNLVSIVLSMVSLIVHTLEDTSEITKVWVICIYYFLFLSAITIVSGFIGYWMERASRKEFKLIRTIESKIEISQNCLGCMLP